MKKLSIYLILFVLVFSGCKKYEEGPLISLRSKEKRLCQEWSITKALYNGEVDDDFDEGYYYWDIRTDGDLVVSIGYEWDGVIETESFTLTWEWSDDKEAIFVTETYEYKNAYQKLFKKFKNTYESETVQCNIIKLKYNELILEYSEDGDSYRMEFEQKE